eukprot:CAMPEP_0183297268 /NCGR_PEP_ID=MMETSP0160_2-20130417/4609_1 /TAXON_ID=2839 ORGANISM="Odontella Sinensis, Strain Grunow 1884" /NCGR_SAMPLE_ID=MMETSP0160_2 /ASSEMBLY_ACC=CAM_ASM_000250 /LENGTH=171 /DNA_ID=CAMNT_0025459057 /DNA_START=66 /DNA_END=581 /DNA_ORIENTATION=-
MATTQQVQAPGGGGGGSFAQHAREEDNRRAGETDHTLHALPLVARVALFLGVPLLAGSVGLVAGYLTQLQSKRNGGKVKEINFDRDFIFPFMLALVMVVVIGIRTRGFKKKEITPLVAWPKVRRKKKVVRKRVIIDDDGNTIEEKEEEITKEDLAALKEWNEQQKNAKKED